MIDEDDPIVEEIPVYLSKTLAENIYVIQFPIQNYTHNINRSNIANCCFKPKHKQLKIDFKLDTASVNYDAFKGEMLAKIADGNRSQGNFDKNDHPTFSSGRMDKATYISSIATDNPRFVVGIMEENGFYLVPVKTILQMHQKYLYFDKGDKRIKTEKGELEDDDAEEDLKQVTVKFARSGDSEKIKKAREKSYRFISQIGKDEPWCETLIYPKTSTQSMLERHKLSNINLYSGISSCANMSMTEYFEKLVRSTTQMANEPISQFTEVIETDKSDESGKIKEPISRKHMKTMPLLDQLKFILKTKKVMSFNELMEFFDSPEITIEKVLQNLKLCGVLIRGNWTLQSDILYPPSVASYLHGISSELMCKGRDLVLFKLMKNDMASLTRQKIATLLQLPSEETLEIFQTVACLKSNKTWDLLKVPDYEFEKKYPDIAQRQEALWKAQEEKFLEMECEKNEKRKRTRSVRESKI